MRAYVLMKMLKDTVKICVPLTKDASGYPLTFTEMSYDANVRFGEFEVIDNAGKTSKASMRILVEKTASIENSYQVEYDGTKHNIIHFEEAKDDNANRDHWIIWLT